MSLWDKCCNNPNMVFVQYPTSNGVINVRKACTRCGRMNSHNYKYSERPNYKDDPIYDKKEMDVKYNMFDPLTRMRMEYGYNWYSDYLQSIRWQTKRNLVCKRDNNICQGCLKNPASDVHHTTYDHVGNEFLFELISLCRSCHQRFHNK